jgi:hypothetical protein
MIEDTAADGDGDEDEDDAADDGDGDGDESGSRASTKAKKREGDRLKSLQQRGKRNEPTDDFDNRSRHSTHNRWSPCISRTGIDDPSTHSRQAMHLTTFALCAAGAGGG